MGRVGGDILSRTPDRRNPLFPGSWLKCLSEDRSPHLHSLKLPPKGDDEEEDSEKEEELSSDRRAK